MLSAMRYESLAAASGRARERGREGGSEGVGASLALMLSRPKDEVPKDEVPTTSFC
jgi:hypothetical protein